MELAKISPQPFSAVDKEQLWEIERDPQVSKFMPGKIYDQKDLEEWFTYSTIYAIRDPQDKIIGFVQLYEMGDSLIKRLPLTNKQNLYEISFAMPEKYRYANGLVSSAVRQVCERHKDLQIVAFTDPENAKSIRVLEHSGFKLLGKVKYHANAKYDNLVYGR